MAEFSLFWTTGGAGDGASAYTQAQLQAWLRRTFTTAPATEGVLKNYANGLAVSGAATPLTVATGAAVADGFPYENDAAVSLAVPTPAVGTTGKRVVLRAAHAARTVRIALITSADGVSAFPALTQSAGVTWEISLATLSVTTGGVITVTDARSYAHFNSQVATANIDDSSVTTPKIADANITTAKVLDANITTSKIADANVTTAKIADANITTVKILDANVTTAKLLDANVTAAKIAADSVDDSKIGDKVMGVIARQGGSASIWSTAGTTTQTVAAVRMQCGVVAWSGAAAASGSVTVTLATPFSNIPIAFANTHSIDSAIIVNGVATGANQISILWETRDATTRTAATFSWLAIGPE